MDTIREITSEAELDALLADQGSENAALGLDKDGNPIAKKKEAEEEEESDDLSNVEKGKSDKAPKGKSQEATEDGEEGNEEEGEEEEKLYGNVIEYLNNKHELGLNLSNLPENFTREDEAEAVSDLFERVVKGADEKLRQFGQVQELMEDPEVMALLQAKAQGKGLKDLYANFAVTSDGMTSEQLVFDDFKKKFPKLADEQINKMIAAQKKEGAFDDMAVAIREQRKEDETKTQQQRLQEEAARIEAQNEQRQQEDQAFTGFISKVGKIHDVAFTPDMKEEILRFALKRDKDGLSALDHALATDAGVARAALGILHLERLMGAKTSIKVNQKNKSFVDRLLEKPDQGAAAGSNRQEVEIPDNAFNLF